MQGITGVNAYTLPNADRVDAATPAFARPALAALNTYRDTVDRYDQAAALPAKQKEGKGTDSFLEHAYYGSRYRGFRDGTEMLINDFLATLPETSFFRRTIQPLAKQIANPFKALTQGAISQAKFLGINTQPLQLKTVLNKHNNIFEFLNDPHVYQETSTSPWLSGREFIKATSQSNFSKLFKVKTSLNPFSYLKKVVIGDNVECFANQLNSGNFFSAGLRFMGMTTALLGIGHNTLTSCENAQAKNGNSLWGNIKTTVETATTFVVQSLKTAFIFEAGTIGNSVGKGLVPFITDVLGVAVPQLRIIRWAAAALGTGIFGALAYKMASIIPDPESKKSS